MESFEFYGVLVHVDDEGGDAFVFGAGEVGAGEEDVPVGDVGAARPDFLAVNDPFVAVAFGFGFEASDIGAVLGFGVALAPDFVAVENVGDEAFFLPVGAHFDEGGADEVDADTIDVRWSVGAGKFVFVDHVLDDGEAHAAVFFWPVGAGPAVVGFGSLPVFDEFDSFFFVLGEMPVTGSPVVGEVGFEPVAEFVLECLLVVG